MVTDVSPASLRTWRGRRILALLCAVAFLDFMDASILFSAVATARASHLLATGASIAAAATGSYQRALLAGSAFTAAAALIALVIINSRDHANAGRTGRAPVRPAADRHG